MNVFIFGYGYTAKALAIELIMQGFKVIATSRTPDQYIKTPNLEVIHFESLKIKKHLEQTDYLLLSIPPQNNGIDLVLQQYGDFLRTSSFRWIGYLSSTGVYGDHQGHWVNETSSCTPHSSTAIARLKAEQEWFLFAQKYQLPLHIFRLSGIYGPQRNIIERIKLGKKFSICKKGQIFCRIHVDDIVSTLHASMQAPNPLSVYNVSDDEPCASQVVDNYATQLMHRTALALVNYKEANLSQRELEFYSSSRKVCNKKIKQELHISLKYPSYKEGLDQIWRDENVYK